jgi:uncharacterized protein
MTWLILFIGLVIGAVSGVVGIGGGILFVPALVRLLGMDQHKAQGTSLGALLALVGILAFLEYYRSSHADLCVALLLAVGFIVGGYFGAVVAVHLPEMWLRRIFAVTLVAVGGRMFFFKWNRSATDWRNEAHAHRLAGLAGRCVHRRVHRAGITTRCSITDSWTSAVAGNWKMQQTSSDPKALDLSSAFSPRSGQCKGKDITSRGDSEILFSSNCIAHR